MGRDGHSGRLLRLEWHDGIVSRMEPEEGEPEAYPWIMPSLLDLQVNGFNGVDFQNASISVEDLERAALGLQQYGCGGCLVTLITDDWGAMLAKLRQLVSFCAHRPDLGQFIIGWHLEGPFLSEKEGFRGAHPAEFMRDPETRDLQKILTITGSDPVLLTVAPERKGVISLIEQSVRAGVRVSLGHTAASGAQLNAAVEAGARGVTHFGNGCPQMWERHDNWFWSVVDRADLFVGLIPDGIHLPAPVFRGMHRALVERNQIYYTTDAMSAAGAGPGRYALAGQILEVGVDQVVRQPGQPNFAGSALSPLDGISRAMDMTGESWRSIWSRYSVVPAQFMGLDLELKLGAPLRFCQVNVSNEGELEEIVVHYASGRG